MRVRAMMLPSRPGVGGSGTAAARPSTAALMSTVTRLDAERVHHELRVRQALGARGPVRHAHADHVVRPERLGGEVRHQRAVHAARKAEHDPLEAAPALHLVADELDQPAPGELGIDRERIAGPGSRAWTSGPARDGHAARPRAMAASPADLGRRVRALASCADPVRPTPPPLRRASCSEPSRCGRRISRSASSGRSVRARVISSKSSVAVSSASSNTGASPAGLRAAPPRAPARKRLPALEPHQLRERDVHAVLAGHVLHDPTPPREARRAAGRVVRSGRRRAPGWRSE